jgi:hypothetical protein
MSTTSFQEPETPKTSSATTPDWTPGSGCGTPYEKKEIVEAYNSAMDELTGLVSPFATREPLSSQLTSSLKQVSKEEQSRIVEKATEDCLLVCKVIAPNNSEELFECITRSTAETVGDHPVSDELVGLMTAYKNASTRNLKRQILSLYAYRYPVHTLKKIHEPFGNLSTWQIKQARFHARSCGPGTLPVKEKQRRVRLDMAKVDHFVEFVNRPYFYQDVSYGSKILNLESGEKIQMPNVVRTVTRATMINQYVEYCKEQEYEPLSRSTMFKILEVREASQRKSLQGLDNTAADGAAGFQTLETILESLEKGGMNKDWCSNTSRRLRDAKRYLKTDYRVNCKPDESECADHCRKFALSDENDPNFCQNCLHEHSTNCNDCQALKNTLREMELAIRGKSWTPYNSDHQEDLLYDFERAQADIQLWKAHILRSINQEEAKQDLLKNKDPNTAVIIMDWAMKFLQLKYREKQSDWFGKRGLSWHVSTVISVDEKSGDLELKTYAHLFDACQQDWFAVLSIIENTLKTLKADKPRITRVHFRSDEAGCYHNNFLIASVRDIGNEVGIAVTGYDFSEPQYGKDVCDRILCPMKSAIRRYCNEGHDVLTAQDMHTALSQRPVRGTSACVCSIDESKRTLKVNKIDAFSSYHNFRFEKNGVRVWRAYRIGSGKLIKFSNFISQQQASPGLNVYEGFFPFRNIRVYKTTSQDDDVEHEGLFYCSEPGCQMVFKAFSELQNHLDVGDHSNAEKLGKFTVYDKLRREWAAKFQTVDMTATDASNSTEPVPQARQLRSRQKQTNALHCDLHIGWALHKPRDGIVRFGANVKDYLTKKFNIGEQTGSKSNPAQVSVDMRTARTLDGSRIFSRDEWLTKTQVQGFFSRLAAARRKQSNKEIALEDALAEAEDEDRVSLLNEIAAQLAIKHPVFYDTYSLCDCLRDGHLQKFNKAMLKEILLHFEVPFASRDRKKELLAKLSSFVKGCDCFRYD